MQDGSCSSLPVFNYEDEYGMWCASYWKPDEAELAALNAGGSIRLEIRCSTRNHPVIGVAVTFKPSDENDT